MHGGGGGTNWGANKAKGAVEGPFVQHSCGLTMEKHYQSFR